MNKSNEKNLHPRQCCAVLQAWCVPALRRFAGFLATMLVLLAFSQIASASDPAFDGWLTHDPTPAEPWWMRYVKIIDKNTGDRWVDKTSGKGPKLYVDGNCICDNLYDEFTWWDMGNLDKFKGKDEWVGRTFTKVIDGVTYTVKLWNPKEASKVCWIGVVVHIDKIRVGTKPVVKVSGDWGTSRTDCSSTSITHSIDYSTSAFAGMFPESVSAVRIDGSYVKFSGPLNKSYTTTLRTVSTNAGSNNGLKYVDNGGNQCEAEATSFSDFSAKYNDLKNTKYGWHSVYLQRSTTVAPVKGPSNKENTLGSYTWPNVVLYKWSEVSKLPDFVKCWDDNTFYLTPNQWDKSVTVNWTPDETNSHSKAGSWSVYRYPGGDTTKRVTLATGLSYDQNCSYTDVVPTYDVKYTYEVEFRPNNLGDDDKKYPVTRLTSKRTTSVIRKFTIEKPTVTASGSELTVTWKSQEFGKSGTYTFDVLRTTKLDTKNVPTDWSSVGKVSTSNANETSYSFKQQVSSEPTYYYKVQIPMLDTIFESDYEKGYLTEKTKVQSFSATKGDYSGVVKLSWNVKQVGSQTTNFVVSRLEKGSKSWNQIYTTSGTTDKYFYEDNTVLPGKYYDYRVMITNNGDYMDDDGFCRASGVVSGRVSFGTGTAVADARVDVKLNDDEGAGASQFYAMQISGIGSGIRTYLTDAAKIFDKVQNKDYTVQVLVRPDPSLKSGPIFDLGSRVQLWVWPSSKDSTKRILRVHPVGEVAEIMLPADSYTSITLSVRSNAKDTVTAIYADGTVARATIDLNASNADNKFTKNGFCFGGDYNAKVQFNGYLDEMRVWSKTLTLSEIKKNYNHTLTGTEDGLLTYWPVDEGISAQTKAYDYSKTGGVPNGIHGIIGPGTYPENDADKLPEKSMLGLYGLTDSIGNYVVRGVPFAGDGTNYSVVPSKGAHEFSPAYLTRFVSASSLVHNGVDFTDVSSFTVKGAVYYEGTNYPVKGCNLYVDGTVCTKESKLIETDDNGAFEISVPIGKHYIEVKKDGHTFTDNGRYPSTVGDTREYTQNVEGLRFTDATLVNFSGRVVGGSIEGGKPIGFGESKNNIGQVQFSLTPTNETYSLNVVAKVDGAKKEYKVNDKTDVTCPRGTEVINSTAWRGHGDIKSKSIYIRTDAKTGEFTAMVPPLTYVMSPAKLVHDSTKLITTQSQQIDMSEPNNSESDSLTLADGTTKYYKFNYRWNHVYHSAPTFLVKQVDHTDGAFGLSSYSVTKENGDTVQVPFYEVAENGIVAYKWNGAAVFKSLDRYKFTIEAYENYENLDGDEIAPSNYDRKVPLANMAVKIVNQMSSEHSVYTSGNNEGKDAGELVSAEASIDLELDSLGCATYEWRAGLPNVTAPYTRSLNMSYEIDGDADNWTLPNSEGGTQTGLKAIVLGSLPTGNNFVTAGPDLIQMILRDPPGSNSSATWTTGTVTSKTRTKGTVWDSNTDVTTETHLGATVKTAAGVGIATVTEIEATNTLTVGANVSVTGESADTWTTTFGEQESVSTSDQPEYVGAMGDVFMGLSNNILYGKATNLGFHWDETEKKVVLDTREAWNTGLEFTTAFRYSAWHIENVLIPNLESMRNSMLKTDDPDAWNESNTGSPMYITRLKPDDVRFGSDNFDKEVWGDSATSVSSTSGPSYKMVVPKNTTSKDVAYTDSVKWCNNQISIWKKALAFNEEEKVKAYEQRSKYLKKNYSFDAGTTITDTQTSETTEGSTYQCTVVGSAIIGYSKGIQLNKAGVIVDVSTQTGAGTSWNREDMTTSTAEYSYTLADENDGDAITTDVYDYGDYGPIFRTRGGQTSGPYEGETQTKYYKPGTTIMEATMQIEKPVIDVENAIISDVPSGSAANFTLLMSNQSETQDDVYYKLLLIDNEASRSAKVLINGMPLTESRIIKIPVGETVTKTLQLYQTDQSVLDFEDVGIVLASQTQYDNTTTWDQIADTVLVTAHFVPSSSPVTLALNHTTLNLSTGSDLNISFSDFDRTYKNLKSFRIQYKKQGSTDWTIAKEYVLNKADSVTGNSVLPASGSTVTFRMPMESYSDGTYTFRVLAVNKYGTNDEITRASNEITVVKDMQKPCPLGQPSPSDGILSVGDDISITFNEPILSNELTSTLNFSVSGVLNGAQVDHATALRMDNTDVSAATDASIFLAGKDFSADAWVRIDGAGTLLSHGNGAQKFTMAVDEQNHLVVGVGSNSYTSSGTLPTGQWAFLSLSYKTADNGGVIDATVAYDKYTTTLFSNQPVAAYEGNGPLTVGRKMQGAMHELTLWDEAHDMSEALLNRQKTKNPSTAHLIGYWKMNEGEGTDITDYARNRHMHMAAATWYVNNENVAIVLDGTSHLDIPTAEVSPLSTEDCAIELWMRAGEQTGETQLLQAGKVSLWMTDGGQLRLTSGENTYEAGTASLLDNAWHHVALNILRTGNAAVYVDGVRTMATSAANVGPTASDCMVIGARRTNTDGSVTYDRYLKCQIDEVRLWNATLGASIIKERSHQRLTGKEAGLVAYYPFETKTVDNYDQVVTRATDADLCGSSHVATYGGAIPTYTHEEVPALKQKPVETNVPFSYTASDNTIVITLDEDAAAIEGTTLHFTVKGVSDANGNKSSAVTWPAFVSRNELQWAQSSASVTKHVADEATITATIVNSGGEQQMWTLSGMPQWMKVSESQGTLEALEQSQITITISKSAPIGKHEPTLYLTGNEGLVSPLELTVTVKGDEPDWSVDPKLYDGTMNMVGSLSLMGVASTDTEDIVAAFVGDECRGVAYPTYNSRYDSYFVMMDIYGNTADEGCAITFRAYDASTGTVYSKLRTSKDVAYVTNQFVGRYADPVLLEGTDEMQQTQSLGTGWNWTSLYVVPETANAATVYAPLAAASDVVKSKNSFITSDGATWHGNAMDVDVRSMYKVHMTEAQSLTLTGRRATDAERTITVKAGWNWIGYNNLYTLSVADAFAGVNPQDGDIVKGQQGFAMYDGYEWNGTLQALTPGQGYMFYSTTSQDRTLLYPSRTSASAAAQMAQKTTLTAFTPVDHHRYSGNMCVVALVTVDGQPCASTEIGVFAGDECRAAEVTDASGYAYITIPGDSPVALSFRLAHEAGMLTTEKQITYATDAVCGSYDAPLELAFSSDSSGLDGIADDVADEYWYDMKGYIYFLKPVDAGVYVKCTRNRATGVTTYSKVVVR